MGPVGATGAAGAFGPSEPIPGAVLQRRVSAAIAQGAEMVSTGKEGYRFVNMSLLVYGASGLILSTTAGSTLWFNCGYGVHVANSTGVMFEGFTIDYWEPCFAQGTVKTTPVLAGAPSHSASAPTLQYVDVEFDTDHFLAPEGPFFPAASPGHAPPLWDTRSVTGPGPAPLVPPLSHISVKVAFWDPDTLLYSVHGNQMFVNATRLPGHPAHRLAFTGASVLGAVTPGTLVTVHFRLGLTDPSDPIPTPIRTPGGLTYLITNSSSVTTRGVTLHGGATESVVEGGGLGNHTYDRVRIVRRAGQIPVRLLAANADGFHSSCVRVGPTLINSEISFTGDDLLNIHSRMAIVLDPLSTTSANIIDSIGSSSPADYDDSTLMLQQALPGDQLSFFALKGLVPSGTSIITSLRRVSDPEVLQRAVNAWSEINAPPYSAHVGHDFGARVWTVNWSTPVATQAFQLVDLPRMRPHGSVVRNNSLHDSYMRFGLYDSPGATVQGNSFSRGFPMYVGESGAGWLEGPPEVDGVTVQDNVFVDCYGQFPIM
eukprot:gene4442-807_t